MTLSPLQNILFEKAASFYQFVEDSEPSQTIVETRWKKDYWDNRIEQCINVCLQLSWCNPQYYHHFGSASCTNMYWDHIHLHILGEPVHGLPQILF